MSASAVSTAPIGPPPVTDQEPPAAGTRLVLAATRDLALAADLGAVSAITQSAARALTGADHCLLIGLPDLGEPERPEPTDGSWPSGLVVPVRAHSGVGLGVYWEHPHNSNDDELRLLESLAESVGVALESLSRRQELQDLADTRAAELAGLIYAVSHDLRAPIRHLEGFARILLQDTADLAPETQHSAQRIQDAAVHLREMVNGMLVLSRIGQAEVHRQSVDLAELGREVALSLANAPTPAGATDRAGVVEFVAPENLPVTGDPRLLLTVLQDLLGNAWKFTSRIPRPRVELGLEAGEAPGGGPSYFVRDNGAGFEQSAADRLFGVFQRLHSGEDFPGTGIGLASVKRIVDKHGGTVRAIGSTDSGATFFFTLPS